MERGVEGARGRELALSEQIRYDIGCSRVAFVPYDICS